MIHDHTVGHKKYKENKNTKQCEIYMRPLLKKLS